MKLRRLSALLGALALTFSRDIGGARDRAGRAQVTICHATDRTPTRTSNPNVNISSVGLPPGRTRHGSTSATVWYPAAKADKFNWGDIIPPYDYKPDDGPLFFYSGSQLDAEGQAIWNNGCKSQRVAHAPGIHVVKTASVATLPPGGGSVTYTYVVTNTGNVPLTDVSVSDDKCSPVTYVERRHERRRQARPDRVVDVHLHGDRSPRTRPTSASRPATTAKTPSPTMTPRP